MKIYRYLSLLTLVLSFLSFQVITNINGKIVGVTDGDTVKLLTADFTEIKVRLEGIDCPEKNQAFGQKAKQYASDLCFDKQVTLQKTGEDKYGRTLGYIILPDGRNLNKEILKAGYAWHYKRYNQSRELAELEEQARIAKKGLWSDPHAMAPWEYRKLNR
jgi:endonuclease YncB( thermonuclease family)